MTVGRETFKMRMIKRKDKVRESKLLSSLKRDEQSGRNDLKYPRLVF